MVRQRPVVTRLARRFAAAFSAAAALGLAAWIEAAASDDPPAPAAAKPAPKPKDAGPIDRQPYRIRVLFAVDPSARVDARRREILLADWLTLVRRFVGSPWSVEVAGEDASAALVADPATVRADDLAPAADGVDKLWLIRLSPEGSGYVFDGREFDTSTNRLGPIQRRAAPVVRDAARVFFQFSLDLFSPIADIGDRFGNDVALTVRGASVAPATPIGRVVVPGSVFKPLRVAQAKDGKQVVREIPFTYLRAESTGGGGAKCSIVTKNADPLTKRTVQKTKLVALGIKPGKAPTRLKFTTRPDDAPAAGYVLTARSVPDGAVREIGTTDREGRITVDPIYADSLLMLRLLAGSSEPMREFPMMPGEDDEEHPIPSFDPKPLTVALETQLDSLRDEIIDLVASRVRIERVLKGRFDAEDWEGSNEMVAEFRKLPPRETFADRLIQLKEEATRQQVTAKKAVLTPTAQARLVDLQSLIDRYLDDETFKGYADTLDRLKSGEPAKEKAKGKVAAKAAPEKAAPKPAAGEAVAAKPAGKPAEKPAEKAAPKPAAKGRADF